MTSQRRSTIPQISTLQILIKVAIAVGVSVVALWWACQEISLDRAVKYLQSSSSFAVLTFLIGNVILHIFRVLRWALYISPLNPQLSLRAIISAANLGIGSTFLLPLRLGEFVRPALIQRAGLPLGNAVASIVVERIADGMCSVGMFFLFLSFVPSSAPISDELRSLSGMATIFFLACLILLVVSVLAKELVLTTVGHILSVISTTFSDKVVHLAATFLDSLLVLRSPWRSVPYLLLTCLYWGGSGILIWLLASSYQSDLPIVSGLFTISILVFAVMIPAGPAFAGTYEIGFQFGFRAFGLDPDLTIVIAIVAHIVQIFAVIFFIATGFLLAEPRQLFIRTPLIPTEKTTT